MQSTTLIIVIICLGLYPSYDATFITASYAILGMMFRRMVG